MMNICAYNEEKLNRYDLVIDQHFDQCINKCIEQQINSKIKAYFTQQGIHDCFPDDMTDQQCILRIMELYNLAHQAYNCRIQHLNEENNAKYMQFEQIINQKDKEITQYKQQIISKEVNIASKKQCIQEMNSKIKSMENEIQLKVTKIQQISMNKQEMAMCLQSLNDKLLIQQDKFHTQCKQLYQKISEMHSLNKQLEMSKQEKVLQNKQKEQQFIDKENAYLQIIQGLNAKNLLLVQSIEQIQLQMMGVIEQSKLSNVVNGAMLAVLHQDVHDWSTELKKRESIINESMKLYAFVQTLSNAYQSSTINEFQSINIQVSIGWDIIDNMATEFRQVIPLLDQSKIQIKEKYQQFEEIIKRQREEKEEIKSELIQLSEGMSLLESQMSRLLQQKDRSLEILLSLEESKRKLQYKLEELIKIKTPSQASPHRYSVNSSINSEKGKSCEQSPLESPKMIDKHQNIDMEAERKQKQINIMQQRINDLELEVKMLQKDKSLYQNRKLHLHGPFQQFSLTNIHTIHKNDMYTQTEMQRILNKGQKYKKEIDIGEDKDDKENMKYRENENINAKERIVILNELLNYLLSHVKGYSKEGIRDGSWLMHRSPYTLMQAQSNISNKITNILKIDKLCSIDAHIAQYVTQFESIMKWYFNKGTSIIGGSNIKIPLMDEEESAMNKRRKSMAGTLLKRRE